MRFLVTLIALFALTIQADAQIFRRGQTYYSCQNGSCQKLQSPTPEQLKLAKPAPEPDEFPTGVNIDALEKGYHLNGVKVSKEEAYNAVETTLPELNKKWRLVLVGTESQRKEALAKIGTKDSVVVNVFPPDHFYVKDMKPNTLVTLMRPDGEVVADGGLNDIDAVMDFTKVGPNDPQPVKPKPPIPDPTPNPTPDPTPPAPTPWYLNLAHYLAMGCGAVLTILLRYGFPVVRNWIASKIGSAAEAELEQLVNERIAEILKKMNLPVPVPTQAGWK